jgi:flagellar biosynthesis protein FlhA
MLESSPLLVELGSDLLPLSVRGGDGDLLARISDLRGQIASGLGMVVPKVRVRDNLALDPGECRILVDDQPVLRFRIPAGCCLLVRAGGAPAVRLHGAEAVPGRSGGQRAAESLPAGAIPAQLPWTGTGAWLRREQASRELAGSTLEPVEVVIRSLAWVIRAHAAELLDRDAVRQLLDETARQHPVMVGEILAAPAGLQGLQQVLRSLVSEQVPLRPMHRLLELVQQGWSEGLGGEQLVATLRRTLCRNITRPLEDEAGVLHCFGLSPELERWLADREPRGTARNDAVAASLLRSVETGIWHMHSAGWQPAMVVSQPLRQPLVQLVRRFLPLLRVVGDEELEGAGELDVIARIRMGELPEPLAA